MSGLTMSAGQLENYEQDRIRRLTELGLYMYLEGDPYLIDPAIGVFRCGSESCDSDELWEEPLSIPGSPEYTPECRGCLETAYLVEVMGYWTHLADDPEREAQYTDEPTLVRALGLHMEWLKRLPEEIGGPALEKLLAKLESVPD
jgi:hypothetical protein